MLPCLPPGPWLAPLPCLASIGANLGLIAFLLASEVIAVFATAASVALENYGRGRLLDLAAKHKSTETVEARLERIGAYELTARLLRFLGTIFLAVGIVALVVSGRASTEGASPFPWGDVAVALGLAFVVLFVLNEVLVRLAAGRRPNAFLLRALPVLEVARYATAPIRVPLVLLARLVFRVELQEPESSARDEVLESVEEGEREGSLTADEADMIESIIDLDRATVEEICTPRGEIDMVQENTRLEDAARYMLENGHRRVPAYGQDRDDVVGVVYAFDILGQLTKGDRHRTVREIMRSPFFVPEGKPLNDLLEEMRRRKVSFAVVLNEFGAPAGVVTIEDLLEEIVGEIEDEHDRASPPVVPRDGAVVVVGRTSIEEVNEALAVELPVRDDFETIGGLVFHEMGRVPRAGDRVTVDGVTLIVTEADERTVKRLRIEVTSPSPTTPGGPPATSDG